MKRNHKIWIAIFLVSFIIRLIAAIFYLNFDTHASTLDRRPFLPFLRGSSNDVERVIGDRDCYNTLAKDILGSGKLDTWYGRPPLYSIFLAIGYFIFGFNLFGFFIPQIILASINSVLILFLARGMFNQKTGIIASLLYAFNPHFILSSIQLYSETLYFFLLLSLFLFCQKLLSKPLRRYGIYIGILMALAALCRAPFLVFIPFMLIWLIAVMRKERHKMLILLSIIFVSFSLLYGGWIQKEYQIFRHVFYHAGWRSYNSPKQNQVEGYENKYASGEAALTTFAKKNPKQYFKLCLEQLKVFLFQPTVEDVSPRHKAFSSMIFFIIYPLGYLGIIKALKEKKKLALLILFFIGSTTIFHILTFIDGELRYRLPAELFMAIFAAYGLNIVTKILFKLK